MHAGALHCTSPSHKLCTAKHAGPRASGLFRTALNQMQQCRALAGLSQIQPSGVPSTHTQHPSSHPLRASLLCTLAALPPGRPISSQSAWQVQRGTANSQGLPTSSVYSGPSPPAKRVTLRMLRNKYKQEEPITMVTAYDYPSAVHVGVGRGAAYAMVYVCVLPLVRAPSP